MDTNQNFLTEEEVNSRLTLSQIVSKNYKAAAIFEKYSLDYCCKGKRSFAEACVEKKLDPSEILSELENAKTGGVQGNYRFEEWDLDFLTDYIINNHHKYIRNIIPVIAAHAEKVAYKHGDAYPQTVEIGNIFLAVSKDLKQHLIKEEEILFPFIRYIVRTEKQNLRPERPYFGTISNPIRMMDAEHNDAGESMYRIRELTNNYNPPQGACTTFKTYYLELKEFEDDLHTHIHLENNILFPKSVKLEEKLFTNL